MKNSFLDLKTNDTSNDFTIPLGLSSLQALINKKDVIAFRNSRIKWFGGTYKSWENSSLKDIVRRIPKNLDF